jgi:hypothetical protein
MIASNPACYEGPSIIDLTNAVIQSLPPWEDKDIFPQVLKLLPEISYMLYPYVGRLPGPAVYPEEYPQVASDLADWYVTTWLRISKFGHEDTYFDDVNMKPLAIHILRAYGFRIRTLSVLVHKDHSDKGYVMTLVKKTSDTSNPKENGFWARMKKKVMFWKRGDK